MSNDATIDVGVQRPAQSAKAKRAKRGGIPLFRWLTKNIVWELFILSCSIANASMAPVIRMAFKGVKFLIWSA